MEHYLSSLNIQRYIKVLRQRGHSSIEIEAKLKTILNFALWLTKRGLLNPGTLREIEISFKKFCESEKNHNPLSAPLNPSKKNIEAIVKSKLGKFKRVLPKYFQNTSVDAQAFPVQAFTGLILVIVFLGALGGGLYTRFFTKPSTPFAFPTTLTRAGRVLSYQGRLTDSLGNPITTATNMQFKLYSASSGGSPLYSSGTCSITPDQDGVFNSLVGSSCGAEIDSSVFTENATIYMGTTVGSDSEMTPRQQIANVGYAINSETLQGFPPGTNTSNIPYINNDGDLLINVTSPGIRSGYASANFNLTSALGINIQSASTGDITLNATGSGALLFKNSTHTSTFNSSGDLKIGGGTFNNTSGNEDLYVTGNIESDGIIYGDGSGLTNIGASGIVADSLDFTELKDTLALDAALTLNQTTNTWSQSFTGTTTTGLTYTASSLTSGKAINITTAATAFTGNLLDLSSTGSNASNTGNLVRISSAASDAVVPLMVTNLGTGLSLRVNDETGDSDSSPFIIDSSGNVGIGTTAAGAKLDVYGGGIRLGGANNANDILNTSSGSAPSGSLFWGSRTLCDSSGSCSNGGISADSLDFTEFKDSMALDANLTLAQSTYTWTQTFTGTTGPGFSYTASGAVASGNAAALDINASNASTSVPAVMITNNGSSHALRVNDDGTTTDSTPFVIDASGNVGIGTTIPGASLAVGASSQFQVSSSGVITAPTSSNTINGLIINSGALSGITGYTQTSGNFAMSGSGTFDTGTGAISLNGDTTIAGGKNFALASGAGTYSQTFTGTTTDAFTITAASLTTGSAIVATGPSGGTAGVTDALIKLTSDVGNIGTSNGLFSSTATFDSSAGGSAVNAYIATTNSNTASANSAYSIYNNVADSTALGNTIYGDYTTLNITGNVNATKTAYGVYSTVTNDNTTTDQGTRTAYAGYFTTTGSTRGTNTAVGLYASAASADNNYAAIFDQGNVGIGSTTPSQKLDVVGAVRLGANGNANDVLNTSSGSAPSGNLFWGNRTVCDSSNNCTASTTVPWSSIQNPTTDLSLAHADTASTFTWDTPATSNARDALTLAYNVDASTDATTQRLLVLNNNNDGGSTGTLETLLAIDNKDTNENVTNAILIANSGGNSNGYTNYINAPNFTVTAAGAVTGVGVNSGSGLLQGTGGITVTGTANINATGTSGSNIGNSTGTLALVGGSSSSIDFVNFDVASSGNITVAAGQGLDTNASGILALGNTTATTVNIGNTAATTIAIGAGGSATRTFNIGTGTGADTINIGTGASTADDINLGGLSTSTIDVLGTVRAGDGGSTNYLQITSGGNLSFVGSASTIDKASGTLNINTTNNQAVTTGTGLLTAGGDIKIAGNDIQDSGGSSAITFDGSQNTQTNGNLTVAAGKNLTLTSGAGVYAQTFTGTTTDAFTITAASLTTGSAIVATGPSGATAGVTDALVKLSSDVGDIGTSNGLLSSTATIDSTTASANGVNAYISTTNSNATNANTAYGIYNTLSDAIGLGNTVYGQYNTLNVTGNANVTKNAYGVYSTVTNDNTTTDQGTRTAYAGYFTTTGSTRGTNTAVGLYASAASGDNNYAAIFDQGNVGIGSTAPTQKLDVNGSIKVDSLIDSSNSSYLLDPAATGNSLLTAGNIGIGTTNASARIHAISTTEQLRLGYDASNYLSTTVGSTGGVTLDAVGSGAGFTFSDDLTLAANKNLTFTSGAGTYSQTFTGTTTDAFTITAASLTTGSAIVATGPSGGTAGVTDALVKLTSDVGNIGTSNGLLSSTATIDSTAASANGVNAYLSTTNSNATNANTAYGIYNTLSDSVALGNTAYGQYNTLNITGNVNATKTAYGVYSTVTNDNTTTDQGTRTAYAGYFTTTGSTRGTNTAVGLYASAASADNNYAAIFDQGNVGIGTTAPTEKLSIVSGNPASPYSGVGLWSGASNQYTAYTIGRTVGTVDGYLGVAGGAGQYALNTVASDVVLLSNSGKLHLGSYNQNPALTASSGNVGIGTITPAAKLDVSGDAYVQQDSVKLEATATATDNSTYTNSTNTMTTVKTFNVSISGDRLIKRIYWKGDLKHSTGAASATLQLLNADDGETVLGSQVSTQSTSNDTKVITFTDATSLGLNGNVNIAVQIRNGLSGTASILNQTIYVEYYPLTGTEYKTASSTDSSTYTTTSSTFTTVKTFNLSVSGDRMVKKIYWKGDIKTSNATFSTVAQLINADDGETVLGPANTVSTQSTSNDTKTIYVNNLSTLGLNGNINIGVQLKNTGSTTASVLNETLYALYTNGDIEVLGGHNGANTFCASTDAPNGLNVVDGLVISFTCSVNASDLAEAYPSSERLEPGDITEIDPQAKGFIKKSGTTSSSTLMGIISTLPWKTMGYKDPVDLWKKVFPLALSGRVPVKVALFNNQIKPGDLITSSEIAGIGQKLTGAGYYVSKAIESSLNWNESTCQRAESIDSIEWPTDESGENNKTTCFKIPRSSLSHDFTSQLGSSSQYLYIGKLMAFTTLGWSEPKGMLTSTGDLQITPESTQNTELVYNGNLQEVGNQVSSISYLVSGINGSIDKIGGFSKIISGKISSGLIETKNIIVQSTLVATNVIAEKIQAGSATIAKLEVTQSIKTPVIETQNLKVTQKADINTLKTTEIKSTEQNLTIDLGTLSPTPSVNSNTNGEITSPLSKLIIKGLEGRTVGSIDAAGNASFSGAIAASQVSTDQLSANSVSTNDLAVQRATVNNLEGNEASLSGKLIAKEVEADNIKNIVTNNQELSRQVNEVQQLVTNIRNQPAPEPSYYQSVSDQQWQSVTTESLNVTGTANLYTVTIANNLGVGSLLMENNSVISLSSELALKALDKITFFDSAVVIAKNGTITTEGKLVAKAGVETDEIRPVTDGKNVKIAQLATKALNIDNKYLSATSSAVIIGATDNFTRNGLFAPAIETSVETAGVGILPKEEYEIVIYNEKVAQDSLIYLTPIQNIPDSPMTVVEKHVCTATEVGCKNYFKVSTGTLNHPDLQFNWLIVN